MGMELVWQKVGCMGGVSGGSNSTCKTREAQSSLRAE